MFLTKENECIKLCDVLIRWRLAETGYRFSGSSFFCTWFWEPKRLSFFSDTGIQCERGIDCHGLSDRQNGSRVHLHEEERLFLQRWEVLSRRGVMQGV